MTGSSPSKPTNIYACSTMSEVSATTRPNPDMLSMHVPCAVTPNMGPRTAPETDFSNILYTVITPYNPQALQLALHEADITLSYPNLIHDLTHGSPIGNPPPLWYTFIPNNLTSANIHPEYITNLITAEVAAGHMDGPFTIEQAHIIYGGHFRTCPLGLVEKPG